MMCVSRSYLSTNFLNAPRTLGNYYNAVLLTKVLVSRSIYYTELLFVFALNVFVL